MRRRNSSRSYSRRRPIREPYDRVLIACEGEKTEPEYFKGLCKGYELSSANIKITPADSSAPLRVVEFALLEMKNNEYDKAFCVFDRDSHATFNNALTRILSSDEGKSGKLIAIPSWPCFEVWLCLHFEYRTTPFTASGGKTVGENVKRKLRELYPEYTEGRKNVYSELKDKMSEAIKHAGKLREHNKDTESKNPSTDVDLLVNYLLNLRSA